MNNNKTPRFVYAEIPRGTGSTAAVLDLRTFQYAPFVTADAARREVKRFNMRRAL